MLPPDLLRVIASYLPMRSIIQLPQCISLGDHFWRHRLQIDYPNVNPELYNLTPIKIYRLAYLHKCKAVDIFTIEAGGFYEANVNEKFLFKVIDNGAKRGDCIHLCFEWETRHFIFDGQLLIPINLLIRNKECLNPRLNIINEFSLDCFPFRIDIISADLSPYKSQIIRNRHKNRSYFRDIRGTSYAIKFKHIDIDYIFKPSLWHVQGYDVLLTYISDIYS